MFSRKVNHFSKTIVKFVNPVNDLWKDFKFLELIPLNVLLKF